MYIARNEVAGGLRQTHSRVNGNTATLGEMIAFTYAMIEILAERGLFRFEEMRDERKKPVAGCWIEKFHRDGLGASYPDAEDGKYELSGGVKVRCGNRIHLFRATCGRLRLSFVCEDFEEGVMAWDFTHPYQEAYTGETWRAGLRTASTSARNSQGATSLWARSSRIRTPTQPFP